ncbi:MAG: RNB domain-containing ribonuclease [Verrucomicrobiota bacterium]|jgi:exoribonuclease-2
MNLPAQKLDFQRIAREAMVREGFCPDFPPEVIAEVNAARAAATQNGGAGDLRGLMWSSIDNPESRDLDQVEWAERLPGGRIRVLVGIADVDAVVGVDSATDAHARANGTSVYTGGPVFPMLPERLSTDVTSLGQDADRQAMIMEFVVGSDGAVDCAEVSAGVLRNKARLNYEQVAGWLQNPASSSAAPAEVREQLLLQQEASQRLKDFRREHGALSFADTESVPVVVGNVVQSFALESQNAARDIIENFMIAANVAMARFLRARQSPCLRRIVRTPKRWDRIQAIAASLGTRLPAEPDSKALGGFLESRRQADPDHFPELSLAVLKSLGPGEYVMEHPGAEHEGHFGLAVEDYTHSTAPNRRYADLAMQRLLKAALAQPSRMQDEAALSELAAHCTEREAAARHVERFMEKVAAAILLAPRVGQVFSAMVTGVAPKGVFARLLTVPAEGRIMRGEKGLDVGQKITVRLTGVNPEKGFIDLEQD